MKTGTILIIDDNRAILTALKLFLPNYFDKIDTLCSPNNIINTIESNYYNVVLLDMNFSAGINSGNEGLFWLNEIKSKSPNTEVVLFTAYANIDLAVEAIKRGAFDFIVKPFENQKLVATLKAAERMSVAGADIDRLKSAKMTDKDDSVYWGNSESIKDILSIANRVASTDASILITGENGTGKDVLAKYIHSNSNRSLEPFVRADLGSLTESIFESELFGYKKGAFTDAKEDRVGKFEASNKGTIFLDEIGNIPLHLQSKLLTVLQTKSVCRVGSILPISIDMRVISATNRDLEEMVASSMFREDLLYRINTIHIHMPSLRERVEDIVPMANMFINKYKKKYTKEIAGLDEKASKMLIDYCWPGNIRELEHTIEKSVILSQGSVISSKDLLISPSKRGVVLKGDIVPLESLERDMICRALEKFGGNMSQVANKLGVTRQTLYNKIRKYGI